MSPQNLSHLLGSIRGMGRDRANRVPVVVGELTIEYDGRAVEAGTIPIGMYAQSLLGVSGAIARAREIIDSELSPLDVRVRAQREGSWVTEILASSLPALSTVADASQVVQATQAAWRWLVRSRGRKPTSVERTSQGVRLKVDMGENKVVSMEGPPGTDLLVQDGTFLAATRQLASPLVSDQMDTIKIDAHDSEGLVSFDHTVLGYLDDPDAEPDDEEVDPIILTVERPSLGSPTSAWTVHDGDRQASAYIQDETFRWTVSEGRELFGAGDAIECRAMRSTRLYADGREKRTYYVSKVHKHTHKQAPESLF